MSGSYRRVFMPAAIVTPLLVPVVAYTLVALRTGLSVSETASAMVAQAIGGRPNLLAPAALSSVPIALLFILHWLARKRDPDNSWRERAAWSGLFLVLAVLFWANLTAWPLYMPGRAFPGFPHGLELVIAPLFFAPVAALAGWLIGAFTAARS